MIRYGEESQQVSIERLTQLINSTRDAIQKAASIKTENEFHHFATNVRYTSLLLSFFDTLGFSSPIYYLHCELRLLT